jgi:hypothetical protein
MPSYIAIPPLMLALAKSRRLMKILKNLTNEILQTSCINDLQDDNNIFGTIFKYHAGLSLNMYLFTMKGTTWRRDSKQYRSSCYRTTRTKREHE